MKSGMVKVEKKGSTLQRMLHQWDLQILVIPGILFLLVFSYIPMYGIIMAFQEFKIGDFPGFSQWVGLKQFNYLFKDPNFAIVMRNTLVISALKLVINFPIPIIFAVLVNELKGKTFKKTIQTISYLPHFISWVVTAMLMFDMFSIDGGVVNDLLVNSGLIKEPIGFFTQADYFWGIAVVSDIWKELGWNSIIFIAAITSVDYDMYEAADIDGCNRIQKMWHITIKAIKPTIILLFIFTVGGILNANFDQIMMLTKQMTNAMLKSTANVIDTYVYSVGLSEGRYSFAAAAGLFKSVINFILLLGANYLAAKSGESALF
ncbi:MAG: ABC transporter permease subunit [Oscillospiraceae bacterium]